MLRYTLRISKGFGHVRRVFATATTDRYVAGHASIAMATKATPRRGRRRNRFVVRHGALPPAAQVMHFSSEQWEQFIEIACIHRPLGGKGRYAQVKRLGNAGDAGRDIEARWVAELLADEWDLYQGKHYDHRLTPGDAFSELAKFFTNLTAGVFPRPRHYYFCSPQNAGPDLHDLLANPGEFKKRFIADWTTGKTGLKDWVAALTTDVRAQVEAFDFGKIRECLVRDLITWHSEDRAKHFELFGIEPERGDDPTVPAIPTSDELVYITELLRVYGEHCSKILALEEVTPSSPYAEHLSDSRATFYCAEGLKRFSRDLYPDDEFGHLLNMVLVGIRPTVSNPNFKTGLERLTEAIQTVSSLRVTESKLSSRLRGGDLPGTCHHLVNEKRLRWVR